MNFEILSIISGIIAGAFWLAGDILLVGFDIDREKYKDFRASIKTSNPDLAILMLEGSDKRLHWGALLAQCSIFFMLLSIYALYINILPAHWAMPVALLLLIGFSMSPLAHCAFYYVGIQSKAMYKDFMESGSLRDSAQKTLQEFIHMLNLTWSLAVGATYLGWLLFSIAVITGNTNFPSSIGWLSPLFLTPFYMLLCNVRKVGRPHLNGAGMNLALCSFYIILLLWRLLG